MNNKSIHPSFARLLEAAAERGIFDIADIACAIGETPSAVGMWRYRGVSNRGAVKAGAAFGCSASRITGGEVAAASAGHEYSALARELAAHFDATSEGCANKVEVFIAAVHAINAAARPGESPHGAVQTPPPGQTQNPRKPNG